MVEELDTSADYFDSNKKRGGTAKKPAMSMHASVNVGGFESIHKDQLLTSGATSVTPS